MEAGELTKDEFKDLDAAFVGREEALLAFKGLFSSHHMQNGVYYYARGGQGKTFLLRKIYRDHHMRGRREVGKLIDFFNTANHSKRGLQASIMDRMNRPEAFRPYLEALEQLAQQACEPGTHASIISGLESRADRVFIECCQQASLNRELVLIFDTFERVQNQEAGRWLLEKFLPQVKTPKIVLAGRPVPARANTPGNIRLYELAGLTEDETQKYLHKHDSSLDLRTIQLIHQHTGGSPLIMSLVMRMEKRAKNEMLKAMAEMPPGALVQEDPGLKCALVGSYVNDNPRNYALWMMAFFRRRFDPPMLKYIYDHFQDWLKGESYDDLYKWLSARIFVKKYPHQDSHLLHDEVQQILSECALNPNNFLWQHMQPDLYDLIVERYYPEVLIQNARSQVERNQFISEQLGYRLDRNPVEGAALYNQMRDAAPYDYDLEELLWIEMREHLDPLDKRGSELCWNRLTWLRTQNLFAKAEQHAQDMLERFENESIAIQTSLGHVYQRLGKIKDAKDILDQTLAQLSADQHDTRARVENVRGQVAFRSGDWASALTHYARGFQAATLGRSATQKISIYTNRAYLYSVQGLYELAQSQCLKALQQIKTLKDTNPALAETPDFLIQETYAWMNLGTIRRHTNKYELALDAYQRSRELVEKNYNLEAKCILLGHMGVNQHLHGRKLRRSPNPSSDALAQACKFQNESWDFVTESLEIAQRSDLQRVIADALNRLAKVYREIYHLTHQPSQDVLQASEVQEQLQPLVAKAKAYPLILEEEYRHKLLTRRPFLALDWRERAARLFEVSALAAESASEFHRALDSLIEQLRTLLWLHQFDAVPTVITRLVELKGYDFQGSLFEAMVRIGEAELALRTGSLEPALEKYSQAYIDLACETNFAFYLLADRLRDLEWRLREDVPQALRVEWCNRLEDAWLDAGLAIRHPEMIEMLETLRSEFLAQS